MQQGVTYVTIHARQIPLMIKLCTVLFIIPNNVSFYLAVLNSPCDKNEKKGCLTNLYHNSKFKNEYTLGNGEMVMIKKNIIKERTELYLVLANGLLFLLHTNHPREKCLVLKC